MKRIITLAALFLAGCATVPQQYIAADRATLSAVTPVLRQTERDHPELAPSIDDVLSSWSRRINATQPGAQ